MKKLLLSCLIWFCVTFMAISFAAPPAYHNTYGRTTITARQHYNHRHNRFHPQHRYHNRYNNNSFHVINNNYRTEYMPSYCQTRIDKGIYDQSCRRQKNYMPTPSSAFYTAN